MAILAFSAKKGENSSELVFDTKDLIAVKESNGEIQIFLKEGIRFVLKGDAAPVAYLRIIDAWGVSGIPLSGVEISNG